ncbi:MAG: hypothetical protein FK733_02865 [Asgard group archaeon]|nr:hypothetical protein [Asgard group archaeon]
MKTLSLISKTALSQEGNILGEIIRVEGREDARVIVEQLIIVIKVKRVFGEPDIIQIPLKKVVSVSDEDVKLDIPMVEFKKMQDLYRVERKRKLKSEKDRELIEEGYKKAISKTMSQRYF